MNTLAIAQRSVPHEHDAQLKLHLAAEPNLGILYVVGVRGNKVAVSTILDEKECERRYVLPFDPEAIRKDPQRFLRAVPDSDYVRLVAGAFVSTREMRKLATAEIPHDYEVVAFDAIRPPEPPREPRDLLFLDFKDVRDIESIPGMKGITDADRAKAKTIFRETAIEVRRLLKLRHERDLEVRQADRVHLTIWALNTVCKRLDEGNLTVPELPALPPLSERPVRPQPELHSLAPLPNPPPLERAAPAAAASPAPEMTDRRLAVFVGVVIAILVAVFAAGWFSHQPPAAPPDNSGQVAPAKR